MHVKEQVKEFVHDVKRKFSQKHKRDTCSTFDSYDCSSVDSRSHFDDSSSSSSEELDTSERSRFIRFIRSRTSSTTSKKHDNNVLHKVRRASTKRYRLFSAPSVPSERMVEPRQPLSYQGPESPGSRRAMVDQLSTVASSRDYSDVIDISARGSIKTGSVTPEVESMQPSTSGADRDSISQTQPQFDTESQSDTSGTLVTTISASDHKKSAFESDSRFDSVYLNSDKNSVKGLDDALPDSPHIDPMADLPPTPPPRDEEVILAPPVSTPAATPPQPRSATASPAPVYIPRLTAPSMFLPIPNVRLIFPFSNPLVWWLAPRWSSGSSSVSISLPRLASPRLAWLPSHSTFPSPLHSDFLPPPFLHSRQ